MVLRKIASEIFMIGPLFLWCAAKRSHGFVRSGVQAGLNLKVKCNWRHHPDADAGPERFWQ
jgi:hypothetical protein